MEVHKRKLASHLPEAPLHCLPHGAHAAVEAGFMGLQGCSSIRLHKKRLQQIGRVPIDDQPLALRHLLEVLVEPGILQDTCRNGNKFSAK